MGNHRSISATFGAVIAEAVADEARASGTQQPSVPPVSESPVNRPWADNPVAEFVATNARWNGQRLDVAEQYNSLDFGKATGRLLIVRDPGEATWYVNPAKFPGYEELLAEKRGSTPTTRSSSSVEDYRESFRGKTMAGTPGPDVHVVSRVPDDYLHELLDSVDDVNRLHPNILRESRRRGMTDFEFSRKYWRV